MTVAESLKLKGDPFVVSPSPYFDSQETICGPTSFNGSDTQSPVHYIP